MPNKSAAPRRAAPGWVWSLVLVVVVSFAGAIFAGLAALPVLSDWLVLAGLVAVAVLVFRLGAGV